MPNLNSDSDDNFEEENKESDVFYLFGTDIREIPCLREPALYGLSCGMVTTLLTFLYTSNGLKASRFGIWTIGLVTLPLWYRCHNVYFNDLMELKSLEKTRKISGEDYVVSDDIDSLRAETMT